MSSHGSFMVNDSCFDRSDSFAYVLETTGELNKVNDSRCTWKALSAVIFSGGYMS